MVKALGSSSCSRAQLHLRQGRHRQAAGELAEARGDGVDGQLQHRGRDAGGHHGRQERRHLRHIEPDQDDDRQRPQRHRQVHRIHRVPRRPERAQFDGEVGRQPGHLQPEQILDLTREYDHGDAGGETGDHGVGDVFDPGAQPQQAGGDQHQSGHQRGDYQPVIAVGLDDIEHHHHEGAGRAADLEPAAAKGGDQEPADHHRDQALVRRGAAGDGQRHGQGQGDNGDGQARQHILAQIRSTIALLQHGVEFRHEQMPCRVGRQGWRRLFGTHALMSRQAGAGEAVMLKRLMAGLVEDANSDSTMGSLRLSGR